MMNADDLKNWIEENVPASARKLVIAYAMESTVLEEIRRQAIKEGASEMVLDAAKAVLPMVSAKLFGV